MAPVAILNGKRFFGDGVDGSGTFWAVYSACDLPADDSEAAFLLGLAEYYGGPGQYFQGAPQFRRVGCRVLVTVDFGYDC